MTARRHINEQKTSERKFSAEREVKQNFGKTTVTKIDKSKLKKEDYTQYEEVD